jgi:hypothetical protein
MRVNDGMEKYVLAHARGADSPMEASLASVTVSGLSALPLAATVSAVVSVWLLPLVADAKLQRDGTRRRRERAVALRRRRASS